VCLLKKKTQSTINECAKFIAWTIGNISKEGKGMACNEPSYYNSPHHAMQRTISGGVKGKTNCTNFVSLALIKLAVLLP
jgi:hypothetical protein